MQINLSTFSSISCFWKWNLGCNDHLNCWPRKKLQNCHWPKTVCMRTIRSCLWSLCSALCRAATWCWAEVPRRSECEREKRFLLIFLAFLACECDTASPSARSCLFHLLPNRFPPVKSWRSWCYLSLWWESLRSVLMDFLRGDFKNCSPRIVLKWEFFWQLFSTIGIFHAIYLST